MAFGLHYSDTIQGRVFTQSCTPLGLVAGVYTGTATGLQMPIFNPPNSNRNVELISLDLNYVSGGAATNPLGGIIVIMGLPLLAVATGALCTAFTQSTPINQLLGSGNSSRVLSSNTSAPITVTAGTAAAPSATAPGMIRGLYAEAETLATSTTPIAGSMTSYQFNGSMIIPPGFMIYLAASATSVPLFCYTWTWKEIPIVANAG